MAADDFQHWATCPDTDVDLAQAALAIARDEYPELDTQACLARLDAHARAVSARLDTGADDLQTLDVLDHHLFQVEGFAGNRERYYDPRNSYLNEVLERRVGIPITLCTVYLEVGWRLGLDLVPLGFPGHFLVGLRGSAPAVIVDPFHAGRRPGEADLSAQLVAMLGTEVPPHFLSQALAPVPRREVVARMLRNLKSIHSQAGDWARALRTTDRLVSLLPEVPAMLRDRAQLYERVEAHRAALEDYQRYLDQAPGAEDSDSIRAHMDEIRPLAGRLN